MRDSDSIYNVNVLTSIVSEGIVQTGGDISNTESTVQSVIRDVQSGKDIFDSINTRVKDA